MAEIAGTAGYGGVADRFIKASQGLDFAVANAPFLPFFPEVPSRILDAGAGAGQNAAGLAQQGHRVVAVEPMTVFRDAARAVYPDLPIQWVADSLPLLANLDTASGSFDFILVQAVWHHLNEDERAQAMTRLAGLLASGGACAISLRHGPAGAGTHVFPTDGQETAALACRNGLDVVLHLANQRSVMINKPDVRWTHLVLRK
jgi:SAM-dependent methyltransferase